MTRGRKPKPTIEKQLAGNPGKRALNLSEPKPAIKIPSCPPGLKGDVRRAWTRLARELYQIGVLTEIDRDALAMYCVNYVRWLEAEEIIKQKGPIMKTSKGNLIQNPYLAVANRAGEILMKIGAEFGMTPSSRTRIHAEPPDDGKSLADMLFGELTPVPSPTEEKETDGSGA
jgi:P27 family predicted phage terminase small subunit